MGIDALVSTVSAGSTLDVSSGTMDVSNRLIATNGLFTIGDSNIRAMNATPVQVLAGAFIPTGYFANVLCATFQLSSQTVSYTDGSDIYLQYGSAAGGPIASQSVANTVLNGMSVDQIFRIPPGFGDPYIDKTSVNDVGVYLTCSGTEFATGDGVLQYFIVYQLVSLA